MLDNAAVRISGKSLILPPLFSLTCAILKVAILILRDSLLRNHFRVRIPLGLYLKQIPVVHFPQFPAHMFCCTSGQPHILGRRLTLFQLRIALHFAVTVLTFLCCLCLQLADMFDLLSFRCPVHRHCGLWYDVFVNCYSQCFLSWYFVQILALCNLMTRLNL